MTKNDKQEIEFTCQLFIDSVKNYFERMTDGVAETGVPYIKNDELVLKDYTGLIGISGNRKGFIYITGEKSLYNELVKILLAVSTPDEDDILDIAGELANTVSGNVREVFGNEFMISVPILFQGTPEKIKIARDVPVYVVPLEWKNHKAYLVIGIK
jgi:chemotaxis protein CheX